MAENNKNFNDEILIVGDRVDIVVPSGQVYRAMIEDRIDNGPFLAAVPSRKGIPMQVEQESDIYLVFYRESGRYIAQMKVVALENRGTARYMWMLQKTTAQKNQRREAYRLPVGFSVQVYEFDEDGKQGNRGTTTGDARALALETADSKDLSVTGIALITKKQYTLEDKYILVMNMESSHVNARIRKNTDRQPPLHLTATVKRSVPWRVSGKFNTGMHFTGITKDTSEEIAKFVLTEQQRLIKMRRLG